MLVRLSIAAAVCALMTATPVLAADAAGAWIFTCDTPSGVRTFTADFKVDGDKVSGTWDKAPVQGTLTEGKLDLSFPYTPQETSTQGTLQLKGQLEGDSITGTWAFDTYNGNFKAARPPALDVTGGWKITGDVVGNAIAADCTLTQNAAAVGGTCTINGASPAVTGQVAGKAVTFQFPVSHQGTDYTLVFKGNPTETGDLKGDIEVAGVTGTFTAAKTPAATGQGH
jgi:hypothetical protein